MKAFFVAFLLAVSSMGNLVIDFGKNSGGNDWVIVNDDVMGGRSNSTAYLTDTTLFFSGTVSLENNGGFASIRGPYQDYDLSDYSSVTIRHRGTSREFALSLDRHRVWYLPNYKHEFTPTADWQETTIPLSAFKESRVGRYTGNTMSAETQSQLIRMGIILFDKKEGAFELEIDFIRFNK